MRPRSRPLSSVSRPLIFRDSPQPSTIFGLFWANRFFHHVPKSALRPPRYIFQLRRATLRPHSKIKYRKSKTSHHRTPTDSNGHQQKLQAPSLPFFASVDGLVVGALNFRFSGFQLSAFSHPTQVFSEIQSGAEPMFISCPLSILFDLRI